jgi:hypothetical protein
VEETGRAVRVPRRSSVGGLVNGWEAPSRVVFLVSPLVVDNADCFLLVPPLGCSVGDFLESANRSLPGAWVLGTGRGVWDPRLQCIRHRHAGHTPQRPTHGGLGGLGGRTFRNRQVLREPASGEAIMIWWLPPRSSLFPFICICILSFFVRVFFLAGLFCLAHSIVAYLLVQARNTDLDLIQ